MVSFKSIMIEFIKGAVNETGKIGVDGTFSILPGGTTSLVKLIKDIKLFFSGK
jgi:hypothetical protein